MQSHKGLFYDEGVTGLLYLYMDTLNTEHWAPDAHHPLEIDPKTPGLPFEIIWSEPGSTPEDALFKPVHAMLLAAQTTSGRLFSLRVYRNTESLWPCHLIGYMRPDAKGPSPQMLPPDRSEDIYPSSLWLKNTWHEWTQWQRQALRLAGRDETLALQDCLGFHSLGRALYREAAAAKTDSKLSLDSLFPGSRAAFFRSWRMAAFHPLERWPGRSAPPNGITHRPGSAIGPGVPAFAGDVLVATLLGRCMRNMTASSEVCDFAWRDRILQEKGPQGLLSSVPCLTQASVGEAPLGPNQYPRRFDQTFYNMEGWARVLWCLCALGTKVNRIVGLRVESKYSTETSRWYYVASAEYHSPQAESFYRDVLAVELSDVVPSGKQEETTKP